MALLVCNRAKSYCPGMAGLIVVGVVVVVVVVVWCVVL